MRSISELNVDYLSQALGTLVDQFSVEPVGAGFMADVYRLSLSGPAVPASAILKLPAQDPDKRQDAAEFNSYGKESFFYRELADLLRIRTPRCYYNPVDHFCLLLEDVGETKTLVATDALNVISELHQSKLPAHELPGFREGFIAAGGFLKEQAENFLQSWPTGAVKDLTAHYCEHSLSLLPQFESLPQVLSHMDFRPDNLSGNEEQIILFDWGEFCLAPAGFDLASLFLNICTADYRRQQETNLLQRYAEDNNQTIDRVMDSYRLSLLPQIYLPMLMHVRGQSALSEELTSRLRAALSDHVLFLQSRL